MGCIMLSALDERSDLTFNQKKLIFAGAFGLVLEFLDYFLIGFVLTFVSKPWKLTFGTSSIILLSSGLGAIAGAAFFGWLADRIGRRRVFLSTLALFSLGTGALVFTPDSAEYGWIYLTLFRFVIGFGAGGLYCVDLPLIQEFVPASRRGEVSGLVTAAVPLGFLLGSAMVAFVAPTVGWRGLMGICVGLGAAALLLRVWIPESPRWLLRNGRTSEARDSIAWAIEVDPSELPLAIDSVPQDKPGFGELLRYPRSVALSFLSNLGMQTGYYGLTLWAPTLLVHVLHVPPTSAAFYMIFVTSAALLGRIGFSVLSEKTGRRPAGLISSFGAAAMLLAAALFGDALASVLVAFVGMLALSFLFGEGGFAVVGPYSAEVWPTALRATGMGAGYGFGGLGKVIGPMGLAFIVGASSDVVPASSGISFSTAFIYFACWYALAGLAFAVFGMETKGRTVEDLEWELRALSSTSSERAPVSPASVKGPSS